MGQVPSRPAKLRIEHDTGKQGEEIASGTIPSLKPYEERTVEMRCAKIFEKGVKYHLRTVIDLDTPYRSVLTSHVVPLPRG